jgi:predicted O-methyltransferase YrrM
METYQKWTTPYFSTPKLIDPVSGLVEIDGVQGLLMPRDIEVLCHYASGLPRGARVVEIGSFMGLSALAMAKAFYIRQNYTARIYCVDTWEGSAEHRDMEVIEKGELFERFKRNIAESGLAAYFIPLRKDSVAASGEFQDESFDLIFVDGDHTFEGVSKDLVSWYPKLKPEGVFLGHDYGYPDVVNAVNSFIKDRELCVTLFGIPPYSGFMYRLDRLKAVLK